MSVVRFRSVYYMITKAIYSNPIIFLGFYCNRWLRFLTGVCVCAIHCLNGFRMCELQLRRYARNPHREFYMIYLITFRIVTFTKQNAFRFTYDSGSTWSTDHMLLCMLRLWLIELTQSNIFISNLINDVMHYTCTHTRSLVRTTSIKCVCDMLW